MSPGDFDAVFASVRAELAQLPAGTSDDALRHARAAADMARFDLQQGNESKAQIEAVRSATWSILAAVRLSGERAQAPARLRLVRRQGESFIERLKSEGRARARASDTDERLTSAPVRDHDDEPGDP